MLGLNLNRLLDRLVPCNLVFSFLGKNRESLERGKDLRIAFPLQRSLRPSKASLTRPTNCNLCEITEAVFHTTQQMRKVFHVDIFYHL